MLLVVALDTHYLLDDTGIATIHISRGLQGRSIFLFFTIPPAR